VPAGQIKKSLLLSVWVNFFLNRWIFGKVTSKSVIVILAHSVGLPHYILLMRWRYRYRQCLFQDLWGDFPKHFSIKWVNFAYVIMLQRIQLVFFYLCDRICTQWLFLLNGFRAAVSVFIGPCCPALLESYLRKCAYCCIIGQMKWWWWWKKCGRNEVLL